MGPAKRDPARSDSLAVVPPSPDATHNSLAPAPSNCTYEHMEIDPKIFVKLMIGAFALTLLGFVTRGTTTLVLGADTAELISAPVFLLAIGCAIAGFFVAVTVKIQELRSDAEPAA